MAPEYVVVRVRLYNDTTREWSMNNIDNVSFEVVTRVPGDFDKDGDVDQSDFGHLQACYTGPGTDITDPECFDAFRRQIDSVSKIQSLLPDMPAAKSRL